MIAPCDPPNANQNNPEHLFSIYVLLIGSKVLHHHFQDEECTLFTAALIQPTTWVFLHVYYQFWSKQIPDEISLFNLPFRHKMSKYGVHWKLWKSLEKLWLCPVEDLGSALAAVACTGSDNKLENHLCGWDVGAVAMTTLNLSKVELKSPEIIQRVWCIWN